MPAKYEVGQKVTVRSVGGRDLTSRDSDLRKCAGLTGEITNYYSISPPTGEDFYLYTVIFGTGSKDVVLYEDELLLALQ